MRLIISEADLGGTANSKGLKREKSQKTCEKRLGGFVGASLNCDACQEAAVASSGSISSHQSHDRWLTAIKFGTART